jgi:hypothetical protein
MHSSSTLSPISISVQVIDIIVDFNISAIIIISIIAVAFIIMRVILISTSHPFCMCHVTFVLVAIPQILLKKSNKII